MAKKVAPAAPVKGKKTAPAPAPVAKAKAGSVRNVGKTSGLKIYEFQNKSLEENETRHATDEVLAKEWRAEFPKAMAFDAHMVRVVRNLYNKGKHHNEAPDEPFHGYEKDGSQIRNRGEKKAEADAEAAPQPKTAKVKKFKKASAAA